MMMIRVLLLTVLVVLANLPAFAQDATSSQQPQVARGLIDPLEAVPDKGAALTDAQAGQIFQQCRSTYPRRFTPSALDYYCNCAAAATQGTMTAGEYAEIQLPRNRKPTNATYQKYIANVVGPCMDAPSNDIEYYECILDRQADIRIKNLPEYCQCVSYRMQQHVANYGDVDIILSLSSHKRINDPFEALWISSKYKQARREAKENCLGGFVILPPRVTVPPENDMRKRREQANIKD